MPDGRGCLLPKVLPEQLENPQEQRHHWYLMTYLIELPKIKGAMADNGKIKGAMADNSLEGGQPPKKARKLANSGKTVNFVDDISSEGNDCCDKGGGENEYESSEGSIIPGLYDDNIAMNYLARASRSDYGALALVNKKMNSLVKSGELYVLRRNLGIAEHWVYFICNLVGWEAFDPNRRRWMRLTRMPADDCFTYADKESLGVGTELLVFGREVVGFVIWRYSILTHSWYRAPPMRLSRCLFGSSSCKEIAIVAGGCDASGVVLKSAELYNSELGTWESLPDMHFPRKLCSGFFMDGKFYVIGGMMNLRESLTCGEEFNLQTRTWRRIPDMFPGGNGAGAADAPPLVAVVNDQLYSVEHSKNEVKKYNKETNTWHVLGRLPVRADSTKGWGLAFRACGNQLIVIGGQRGPEGEIVEVNSWLPNSEGGPPQWNLLAVKEHAGVFVYNCAVMGC